MDRTEVEALMLPGDSFAADLIRALRKRPAWHADAACREHPDVSWFPERGESTEPAKAICRECIVREECRAFAETDFAAQRFGIWGGSSSRERRADRAA